VTIEDPQAIGMVRLLMNAFNTLNLSAACILTTTSFAKELGIPQHHWTYPLARAGTNDEECEST
jgi:hypothetical protein